MKWVWMVLIVLIVLIGCRKQSSNARFVTAMEVDLVWDEEPGTFEQELDFELVDGDDDRNIYSAAHGFLVTLSADTPVGDMPTWDIQLDCYVGHSDLGGGGGDIWDTTAPNGKKYGYVTAFEREGATWDYGDGHATAVTDENGQAWFYVGLGCPMRDDWVPGWEWPDVVSTAVDVDIFLKRPGVDIENENYCDFVRAAGEGYWADNGVYAKSFSSTEPVTKADPGGMRRQLEAIQAKMRKRFPPKPPRDAPDDYPLLGEACDGVRWESDGVTFLGECWKQLVYDDGWKWRDFAYLLGINGPRLSEPNACIDRLSLSFPYAYFCKLELADTNDINDVEYTVTLESKDPAGNVVSWRPVKMFPFRVYDEVVIARTEFIVGIDDKANECRAYDRWGEPGTFIYMVHDGYLVVVADGNSADFNFDGQVDLEDFSLFADKWMLDVFDADFDLLFDTTLDGEIGPGDIAVFMENWLGTR